jgi:hypothetical protein
VGKANVRNVIVHYHIFKNAGTSIDQILKSNFGAAWKTLEADSGDKMLAAERVRDFLLADPSIKALSSHTALLPFPRADGLNVIPILFLRHPIDRIRSAYEFERKQGADTRGAQAAREHAFPEYVQRFLDAPADRRFRNFQVWRVNRQLPWKEGYSELELALEALPMLPVVGIVEDFERSLRIIRQVVTPRFPGFATKAVRANASSASGISLEAKLDRIRQELGAELYRRVEAHNLADWILWERARGRLCEQELELARRARREPAAAPAGPARSADADAPREAKLR